MSKKRKWLPKAEWIKQQKEKEKLASTPEEKEALKPRNRALEKLKNFTKEVMDSLTAEKPVWDTDPKGSKPLLINPWNLATGKEYKGINWFYLSTEICVPDSAFATFRQSSDNGWKIRKGSRAYKVVFARAPYDDTKIDEIVEKRIDKALAQSNGAGIDSDTIDNIREKTEQQYSTAVFKLASVFNRSDLIVPPELEECNPKPAIPDGIVKTLVQSHKVNFTNKLANNDCLGVYLPGDDKVMVRSPDQYHSKDAYERTALHELTHWAGAKGRTGTMEKEVALEELIAELGCWILCGKFGLRNKTRHVNYLKQYWEMIKRDKKTLTACIKKAQKRVDFLLSPVKFSVS